MALRRALTATAVGFFAYPALAAEPFAMQTTDVQPPAPAPRAAPGTFQMLQSDVTYDGTSRADGATITRNTDENVIFRDDASAADAAIVLNAGGNAFFEDRSTAETALLTVNGGATFSGTATAGNAAIVTNATGQTRFTDGATAGAATIENNGTLTFEDTASAAAAALTNNFGGSIAFTGDSDAGGGPALTNGGTVRFTDQASANNRFIANNATGAVVFDGAATADSAVIANSGTLRFDGGSTLENGRVIGNQTGTIDFAGTASAGSGEISHAGVLRFSGQSSAGSALVETLTGGVTYFSEGATGAQAEIRLQSGAVLDFSGITTGGTSVASLLGTGRIYLGGIALTVGDNGPQRTVGGISDGGASGGTGGALIKVGSAVLGLEGANTYTGVTDVRMGTLLGASANAFAPGSAVTVSDGALLDIGGFEQEIGSLSGAGRVDLAASTLTLGGDGRSTVFSGLFTGAGGFAKEGGGTFTIANSSAIFGASTVTDGTLVIAGGLPLVPLSVTGAGTVTGSGTVGSLSVGAGGTLLAAGPSLQITDDLTFSPGVVFAVTPSGSLTPVAAGGMASLNGADVVVADLDLSIPYSDIRRQTILVADTITGAFAAPRIAGGSAFLTPSLDYGATTVSLILDLPTSVAPPSPGAPPTVFVSVAETRNQFATAQALDGLGQTEGSSSLRLYNAILFSDADTARSAFDQLSGEGHASIGSTLMSGSRHTRAAVGGRLQNAFGAEDLPPIAEGDAATIDYGYGVAGWGQAFGAWGSTDGDGNAARLSQETGGFFVGLDGLVTADVRLGAMAGYAASTLDVASRAFSASVDSYTVGLYAGTEWSGVGLTGGATYTWHEIDTDRAVAFGRFTDALSADYGARTTQVFGEVGYKLYATGAVFEPFAGLAYVNLDTGSFTESGGAAALSSGGSVTETTYSTLGLRASTSFAVDSVNARINGSLAWQHAYGDVAPTATFAFAGGRNFTIGGVPIAADSALVQAGLELDLMENMTLGLAYDGRFGDGTDENGARFYMSVRF